MPFKKGDNKYQKMGVIARRENKEQMNRLLIEAITGGFKPYSEKVQKLRDGIALTEQELNYLDRMEKWVEHYIPKLARQEIDHTSNGQQLFGVIVIPPEKQDEYRKEDSVLEAPSETE